MYKFCLFFILMVMSLSAYSQKKPDPLKNYLPTDNIDARSEDNRRANEPKRKRYRQLIVNKTKNVLYGNPCALEATRKMGFEYVVQSPAAPGSITGWPLFWNNFKVKTRLFFLRSPLWKPILKGKFKKCRVKSGDKVG